MLKVMADDEVDINWGICLLKNNFIDEVGADLEETDYKIFFFGFDNSVGILRMQEDCLDFGVFLHNIDLDRILRINNLFIDHTIQMDINIPEVKLLDLFNLLNVWENLRETVFERDFWELVDWISQEFDELVGHAVGGLGALDFAVGLGVFEDFENIEAEELMG